MNKKIYPAEPEETEIGKFSERISLDKMGSYTGLPAVPWGLPVQDADDL